MTPTKIKGKTENHRTKIEAVDCKTETTLFEKYKIPFPQTLVYFSSYFSSK